MTNGWTAPPRVQPDVSRSQRRRLCASAAIMAFMLSEQASEAKRFGAPIALNPAGRPQGARPTCPGQTAAPVGDPPRSTAAKPSQALPARTAIWLPEGSHPAPCRALQAQAADRAQATQASRFAACSAPSQAGLPQGERPSARKTQKDVRQAHWRARSQTVKM